MSAFSTEVRVVACPHCGAPLQLAREGGHTQCGYCQAQLDVVPRDDAPLHRAGASLLTEAERIQGLWAQASGFGMKILPPEMRVVLAGGALTADRVGGALGIWRTYCQRAYAGDAVAGDHAVLITGSIASYFAVVAKDAQRQRALFESTLDALRDPAQKQVLRCHLARLALRAGDPASARAWFAACDASSPDLQADTAYRVTYAHLATAHGDFANVLAALGATPSSIAVAMPSRLQVAVLRANAVERTGDVNAAVGQLLTEADALPGGRQVIPEIAETNAHLQLCPQSMVVARKQW